MSMEIDSRKLNAERNRRTLSNEMKMKVFTKFHMERSSISSLAREWNISTATVKRIIYPCANSKKTERCKTNVSNAKRKAYADQRSAIYQMEKLLTIWIEDQIQRNIPLAMKDVQAKAADIYIYVKRFYPKMNLPFKANDEWLARYRHRAGYCDLKMMGEPVFDTLKKAKNFPDDLKTIIDDGKYEPERVFNLDRMLLFWKNMPDGTYISKESQEMASDRVTLVLGCNAAGDCKLKPLMVYNTTKPRNVNLHYQFNATSWITARIFEEWFLRDFIPETKCYCQKKGIPFKILLLLDTAARYRKEIIGLHPNVKVVFLPKCASRIIQPMHQGIMSMFKAYYLAHTLNMVTQATRGDTEVMVQDFCESYNIRKGVTNIKLAWDAVPKNCLVAGWKRLCPQFVDVGLVSHDNTLYQAIKRQILSSVSKLGFEMSALDVESLIQSSGKELTNDDLITVAELIDAEEVNGEIDLTDEGQSYHSADVSLLDDDCVDITDDFLKAKCIDVTIDDCAKGNTQESIKIDKSPVPVTVYSLNQCSLNDKDSMDYEQIPIDYIKIEEPQLSEPTILNDIQKKVVDELKEPKNQESLTLIQQTIEIDTPQSVDSKSQICYDSSEQTFNEEYLKVKEFKSPLEMTPSLIAEEIELAFDHITCAMETFESVDPNNARFQAVRSAVNDMLACYREMFEDKRRIRSPDHKNG